jgi:hypothetical protein
MVESTRNETGVLAFSGSYPALTLGEIAGTKTKQAAVAFQKAPISPRTPPSAR